jgi:hypothetical protein
MVNVPGYNNITPLHEAVLNNKLEAVKLLLMYGADVEARDVNGMTPRYVIIKSVYLAIMCLIMLLKEIKSHACRLPSKCYMLMEEGIGNKFCHPQILLGYDLFILQCFQYLRLNRTR